MQIRSVRWIGVAALLLLGVYIASATWGAAGPSGGRIAVGEPAVVALRIEEVIQSVLTNHPDLEAGPPSTAQAPRAHRGGAGRLVVRPSSPSGRATQQWLEDLVDHLLFQAIESYWGQVRRIGEVEIRRQAVAEAEAMAAGSRGRADPETARLLAQTAQTFLAEARIALHQAVQQRDAGEDELKLLMNDETLSVSSETRLELLTEAPEPLLIDDPDLLWGIETAVHERLGAREDRRDKSARREYEMLAMEVKSAYRRAKSARAMFLLARERLTAAQKALAAAARLGEAGDAATAGLLLAEMRAQQALTGARGQELTARVDYEIALAAWDRALGRLAETWRIGLDAGR